MKNQLHWACKSYYRSIWSLKDVKEVTEWWTVGVSILTDPWPWQEMGEYFIVPHKAAGCNQPSKGSNGSPKWKQPFTSVLPRNNFYISEKICSMISIADIREACDRIQNLFHLTTTVLFVLADLSHQTAVLCPICCKLVQQLRKFPSHLGQIALSYSPHIQ